MQLVIDGREFQIPTDFTIKKWIEIQKWTSDPDKILSIAIGLPFDVVKIIPEKTKTLAIALITTALYPSWNKSIKPGLISFDNMTLGQFIDLEVFVSRGYQKNIKEIINILHNTEVSEDELFTAYWPSIELYLKWRITLYNAYKNLFNIGGDDDDEGDYSTDIKTDLAYGWYDNIMILADNKFLNIEPVLQQSLISALNYLAWNKTKAEKEAEQLRQLKR